VCAKRLKFGRKKIENTDENTNSFIFLGLIRIEEKQQFSYGKLKRDAL
jgi:hypothetical protein